MSDASEEIATAALDPKSVAIDSVRVEQHGLAERIAAARFVKEEAASEDPFACIGHRQLRFVVPQ